MHSIPAVPALRRRGAPWRAVSRWWARLSSPWNGLATRRVLDRRNFIAAGEPLVARRSGVLVLFGFEDLPELRKLYGPEVHARAVRHVASTLRRLAAPRGALVARTGPGQFALVWPAADRDLALGLLRSELGLPCRFELDADDGEVVLVPDVMAEDCRAAEGELARVQQLVQERMLTHQRQRRLRDEHLRRERERYSKPATLRRG